MKRIVSLLLCLLMVCLVFTSCSKSTLDKFKEDIDEYKDVVLPSDKKEVELDFYIIYEEGTTQTAMESVELYINSHLSDTYKTTLDIHYLTAAEYEAATMADAVKEGDDRADIILLVGKDMFDRFYAANTLADLTSYYSTNTYGLLNTEIADTLLRSSLVYSDFTGAQLALPRYYTVPNNHVIGQYEYILIDKQVARSYNFSNRQLAEMTTYESTEPLRLMLGENADAVVKQVSGKYTDKAVYEAQGYVCNVASYPIADADEAFAASYAIVRHELDTAFTGTDPSIEAKTVYNEHYDRCMEIVYALTVDVEFRNLLQYGYRGVNYSIDDDGVVTSYVTGDGVYKMNILYTGNLFKAYYSELFTPYYKNEISWNSAAASNGAEQNKESILPTAN